jgi:hypothetical protein
MQPARIARAGDGAGTRSLAGVDLGCFNRPGRGVCVKTVRTRSHKLNYAFTADGEQAELFDLEEDPHEYASVFDDPAHGETREALLRRLLDWWVTTQQPPNFSPGNEKFPASRWFERKAF